MGKPTVVQLDKLARELAKKLLGAQVTHDAEFAQRTAVEARQAHQVHEQVGRQVVDAKIAQVLKGMHGLRTASAGHARDDNQVRAKGSRSSGGGF